LADALLKNLGDGRVKGVLDQMGLAPKAHYEGVRVADYDRYGEPDLYVIRYCRNALWRNGCRRFTDVSGEACVGCTPWSLGSAFLDYNRDGDPTLLVANYLTHNPSKAPFKRYSYAGTPHHATPRDFTGLRSVPIWNDGHGDFTDVMDAVGVSA
jgi:hypothetical protein